MRRSLVALSVGLILAVVPVPAAAQAAESPKSQTPENIKTAADVAGVGTGIFKSAVDCGRVASVQQRLLEGATSYKELGKGFEHIGNVLTLVTATTQAAQGDTAGELQTAVDVALDKAVCNSLGPALCAGWTTGRTVGWFVKQFPAPFSDAQGRSLGDYVSDKEYGLFGSYYEQVLAYMNRPATRQNLQAAYAAYQSGQADLVQRQREADGLAAQCKAKEDSRNAIDEAVARARASANQRIMSSASDPDLVSETIRARTAAGSAEQQISSQLLQEQATTALSRTNSYQSYSGATSQQSDSGGTALKFCMTRNSLNSMGGQWTQYKSCEDLGLPYPGSDRSNTSPVAPSPSPAAPPQAPVQLSPTTCTVNDSERGRC